MISGKTILITGGSSGIGRHLAARLLQFNNKIIIVSNNTNSLDLAIVELRKKSPNCFSYNADIGNTLSVSTMFDLLIQEHGCPDILVNCAGFTTYRTFEESSIAEIEELVNVNLLGAMRCTHFVLPFMIQRQQGIIVNVASIAGKLVMTPNGVYSASKHGLVAWSEALAYELARFNINVSVICPGRVETAFFDNETFRSRIPRKETKLITSIEKVTEKIIHAMEKKKLITFVPGYYGFLIWTINTFAYFSKPVYGRLLRSRIEDIYRKP